MYETLLKPKSPCSWSWSVTVPSDYSLPHLTATRWSLNRTNHFSLKRVLTEIHFEWVYSTLCWVLAICCNYHLQDDFGSNCPNWWRRRAILYRHPAFRLINVRDCCFNKHYRKFKRAVRVNTLSLMYLLRAYLLHVDLSRAIHGIDSQVVFWAIS